jgi:hypothetical protein
MENLPHNLTHGGLPFLTYSWFKARRAFQQP